MIRTILSFLLVLPCCLSSAQTAGSQQREALITRQYPRIVDTSTIVPGSIRLSDEVPFKLENSILTLDTTRLWDSIVARYRVFDFDLEEVYRLLDTSKMQRVDVAIAPYYKYRSSKTKTSSILGDRDIDYAGSFSRGFSVGNAQSLVLNSNFNLQLAGEIGEGVKIVAAISDDNIPIQPEGNTQVLQEFDQVYIKLSRDQTNVVAGDYNLISPQGYFAKYNKRLQGLSVGHVQDLGATSLETRASAAAARGKFARQRITTEEGNQGPYKLQGNNGERFIIIQSGSERVYVDGRLMKRGFEYDYVIDYNRAEVTFSPTRLITKDERVVIEFEYSDQSYLRTVYAVDNEWSTQNGSYYLNMYSEQDSRTATGTTILDSLDLLALRAAGDDLAEARTSGVRSAADLEGNAARILYEWQVVDGDSILVFSPMPGADAVAVTFSEVLQGAGSYQIDADLTVNGRVYKYVGDGMGNYLPSVQLVAPQQQQVLSAGIRDLQIIGIEVSGELALSRSDANRLSALDDDNNGGVASNLQIARAFTFARDSTARLRLLAGLETVGPTFTRLNPFRAQEFARDWNLDNRSSDRQEYLYQAGLEFVQKYTQASYRYKAFDRQDIYQGDRHLGRFLYDNRLWRLDLVANVTSSATESEKAIFYRPKVTLTRRLSSGSDWSVTLYNEVEHNQATLKQSGAFTAQAISYDLSRFILSGPAEGAFSSQLKLTHRRDRLPSDGEWVYVSGGTMIEAQQSLRPSEDVRLHWSIGSRLLNVARPDLLATPPTNTLVGRLDLDLQTRNGFIASTSSYSLDSGQEPLQEFVYFRVENPDLGEYVYLGSDEQGLDQSLFVYQPSDPRSFWRRTTQFNNEFIATNSQLLNQSLRIDFKKLIAAEEADRSRWSSLLRRVSMINNIRLINKVQEEGVGAVNLLAFGLGDTALVSGSQAINSTFFWNKGHPSYDIQLGFRSTANKIVQIVGADLREQEAYFARLRVNLKKYIDLIVDVEDGQRLSDSEQFANRNFQIDYRSISPRMQYRPTNNLRFTTDYEWQVSREQLADERSIINRFTLGANFRRASRESIDVEVSFADIQYDGKAGSVVQYELLQSLRSGRNLLWDISYIRRIAGNVDLTISYQGRRTGDLPTINTARAQVKATF